MLFQVRNSPRFSAELFSVLTPTVTVLMKPGRVIVPEYEERLALTKGPQYFAEGRLLFLLSEWAAV
jgi:hypothetical protein